MSEVLISEAQFSLLESALFIWLVYFGNFKVVGKFNVELKKVELKKVCISLQI